jgi:hypothetical protein
MISSILQYSTIDFRFLETNLRQLSKFSSEIIIPICNCLFNGQPEDEIALRSSLGVISKFPKAKVIYFDWDGIKENSGYYHNLSRLLGTNAAQNEWLLFVDTDEILTDEFEQWFDSIKDEDKIWWFTCHWYFREPIYQATSTEAAGLLIRKEYCNWNVDIRHERQQLLYYPNVINGDYNKIVGPSGNLMMNHFSWVRSKEEMLLKIKNWGHSGDKDWESLVREEFTRDFNGRDFVHGYNYRIVENIFNL